MRKLYLVIASCVALVAFMGFSATAPANIVDPDCDGDPYGNTFALNGFNISTTNNIAYEVAGLTGGGVACGTDMEANFLNCGDGGLGYPTLNDNAVVEAPPGVAINNTDTYIADGAYTGNALVNVASCLPSWLAHMELNVPATVRADPISECVRENNNMVGGPLPGTIVACHRADDDSGVLGHNWNWVIDDGQGNYSTVIGPFDALAGSAGITNIKSFTFCAYAGSVGGNSCGGSGDPTQGLQKNGDPSVVATVFAKKPPACANGNGIYTAKVTRKNGDVTAPASKCVEWRLPNTGLTSALR